MKAQSVNVTDEPLRRSLVVVLVTVLLLVSTAPVAASGSTTSTAVPSTPEGTAANLTSAQAASECEFPVTYTDATSTEVRIEEEPQRVVTLAPSAAQIMWELDAEDKVVGVSQFATYLEGAEQKANVSAPGVGNYEVERMITLETDLVVAPDIVPDQSVEQLRRAGLTVVNTGPATSINTVREQTTLTGRLTGECEAATETNRWMNANVDVVESAVDGRERPKTAYIFFSFTAGDGTFIHDLVRTAGGRNIMAEAGVTGFRPVNEEVVAEEGLEWLIVNDDDSSVPERAPYDSTEAVENGNVVVVDRNFINQPAPRSVVFAARNLTAAFHGEAYDDADYVARDEVPADGLEAIAASDGEPGTSATDVLNAIVAFNRGSTVVGYEVDSQLVVDAIVAFNANG